MSKVMSLCNGAITDSTYRQRIVTDSAWQMSKVMSLCNGASINKTSDGRWEKIGEATEAVNPA